MPLDVFIACRLAREGYGTVEGIRATPTPIALAMFHHSIFVTEAEETAGELNRAEQ